MIAYTACVFLAFATIYHLLCFYLRLTQGSQEPLLLGTTIPFLDPAFGIGLWKVMYLLNLRKMFSLDIYTLRVPFQRLYVVHSPALIRIVQQKANATKFVPSLLDFGILFSGLNKTSQNTLRKAFHSNGNEFTLSIHKYLQSGHTLKMATITAINKLAASIPNFGGASVRRVGLLHAIRHDLTLALTGAIYGPESPYNDPEIEAAWREFLPGINHMLFSPLPWLTAPKSLRAHAQIIKAFQRYFDTNGHLQAFPMIPEMFETIKGHGLTSSEAAKMELATSLAMLSSGGVTTFWLLFHILSDSLALSSCRSELGNITTTIQTDDDTESVNFLDLSKIKKECPTLMAMLYETLRYHSTVLSVKKVQHDTLLADRYLMKKDGMLMIPGTSVHHDPTIWGANAGAFAHTRFLSSASDAKRLSNTSSFRPFGAGATMCPGRHFSTNVMLSFVAMLILQFDIQPVDPRGWKMPTKQNADLWNAMPKPDWDVEVDIMVRKEAKGVKWRFVWDNEK